LYDAGFGDEERIRSLGFDVRPLRHRRFLGRVRELRARIRTERPDVVHTALFAGDMVGRVAAWRTDAKVVSSLVNTTYDPARSSDPNVRPWKLRIVKWVDSLTGRVMVDRFHAVSAGVADVNARDLRIPRARITVVQRGRSRDSLGSWSPERRDSVRAALGVAASTKVVIAVGRQEHQKAHADLVAAIPQLLSTVTELKVLIAGREGNASSRLHDALLANPTAAAVTELLGHRHDVPDLLCAADVLVIPSLYEGTAGVALEAMALRCPVVCTDLAGVRGVLTDDVNALLVPVADPAAMADALSRVLTDDSLAERLRAAGLADFEHRFTIDTAADAMVDFYETVVGGGDAGAAAADL
jgi:glycosyltransferase involved in cell wall biosynthesis